MARRILVAGFQIQPVLFEADLDEDTTEPMQTRAIMVKAADLDQWVAQQWPLEIAKMRAELALAEAQATYGKHAAEVGPTLKGDDEAP